MVVSHAPAIGYDIFPIPWMRGGLAPSRRSPVRVGLDRGEDAVSRDRTSCAIRFLEELNFFRVDANRIPGASPHRAGAARPGFSSPRFKGFISEGGYDFAVGSLSSSSSSSIRLSIRLQRASTRLRKASSFSPASASARSGVGFFLVGLFHRFVDPASPIGFVTHKTSFYAWVTWVT